MKAFLSHSSHNKELVRAVASELGRHFCIFDEQVFSSGIEFKESIEQGFSDSCVFVLFASKPSLESIWVDFEMQEAWFSKLEGSLSRAIVYLIDSKVQEKDLPNWLRRAKAVRENSPQLISRDIKYHINELLRGRRSDHWIWRAREAQELQNVLWSTNGTTPRTIFVYGLPGIGRRTFIKHTTSPFLRLNKPVEIEIEEGLNINDICSVISSLVEPCSTLEGTRRLVENVKVLSHSQAVERTLDNLRRMIRRQELPILIDRGGLLNSDGTISEPIQSILNSITINDEIYLFLVSGRRPTNNFSDRLPVIHIRQLEDDDSKRLLLKLSENLNIPINSQDLSALASYVAGYPPAADVAIQHIKLYGSPITLQRKEPARYRTEVFLKYLSTIKLNEKEKRVLRLFAAFSPLPFNVAGETLKIKPESLDSVLIKLIDFSLLNVNNEGFYSITDPAKEAVSKALGSIDSKDYKILADKLFAFLDAATVEIPQLELSRVLFRVASLAKDQKIKNKAVRLSSDLIKLTETLYHERRYEEAIECGLEAVRERPDSIKAHSFLIRALIKDERYDQAQEEIQGFRRCHLQNQSDAYFLMGFLDRNRGRISDAINHYRDAERFGRGDVALLRELSNCYFLKKEIDPAEKYIRKAMEVRSGNSYVIDLWAQIAISQRNEEEANKAVNQLKDIDVLFYYHRLSCLEFSFGRYEAAENAAELANNHKNSPPFEVSVQLIKCKIFLGKSKSTKLQEAEILIDEIDKKFRRSRKDIRIALRCQLLIGLKRFGEALALCEKITDKDAGYYKKIRRDALRGELLISALDDLARQTSEEELQKLSKEIKDDFDDFDVPSLLDE